MSKTLKQKPKTSESVSLHKWIALGGKPKDYKATKGVNSDTVPGCTCGKK